MRVCTDILLHEVTSNDIENTNRYGITGCAYLKDIIYESCKLNRAEAHEGVYNQTIRNCEIGWRGLQLVGGGNLDVINSTITAWSMVNLRPDYGSFWHGKVRIIDCTYKKLSSKIPMIVDASLTYADNTGTTLMDYDYDLKFPDIYIDNLTIDYNGHRFNDDICLVPNTTDRMKYQGFPYYWPNNLHLNRYKLVNVPSSKVKVRSTWNPIDKLAGGKYDFAITDVTLKLADGTDATQSAIAGNVFSGLIQSDTCITNKNVSLTVKPTLSANNVLSVFKDGTAIETNVPVSSEVARTFTEDGDYRVEVSSVDIGNSDNTGNTIYEFRIDHTYVPGNSGGANSEIVAPTTPAGNSSKLPNSITVAKSKLAKTFKASKKTGKLTKPASFKIGAKAQGGAKITYKAKLYMKSGKTSKTKARKFMKVGANGKITIKKGAPKGTYKATVKITATATDSYLPTSILKVVTVKVK